MAQHEHPSDWASTADRRVIQELIIGALPGCGLETVGTLADCARLVTASPKETIYPQGEQVPMTLILRGYSAFRRTTLNGQHLMAGVARAGDLFGFSCVASVPSSVELVALTDCQVAQWPGTEIRELAVRDPGLALNALDSMAASLHAMIEGIEGFLHQDARRRVMRILARHQDLFFGDPAVLTRAHLPSLVGTSREMTGRVLRQLERDGTVAREGRVGLKLLRPERLEAGAA